MKNRILILCIGVSLITFSQNDRKKKFKFPELKTEINVRKSGPYIGIERGKYNVFELGGEFQWKKVKLIKPFKNAIHIGLNYNFTNNILGYEAGYWFKTGRMNFTYGVNLCYRTDFTHDKIGFSPVIGFKFTQLHFQTGFNFLSDFKHPIPTNTFFVSLRFVIINHRKIDFD